MTLKHIFRFFRKPQISLMVYPMLVYWLIFNAFPQALDGSMAQGAFVFTIAILATIVFVLKLLIIPVSFIAKIEKQILNLLRSRGLNHTPLRLSRS